MLATLLASYLVFRVADLVLLTGRHNAQIAGLLTPLLLWPVVWLLAWWRDWRAIRQARRPRDADKRERAAAARMLDVCSTLGIEPPRLLMTPHFDARDAWVCGLRRPWTLVVERVFAKKALHDPALFDAAIAHELAHIAGGDARRLALFRALSTVVTGLLLAALGVPCLRAMVELASDLPRAWLADGVPVAWMGRQSIRILGQFVAPIVAATVAFRLGYATLLRRQEALADWRAAAAGHGHALRDAAACRAVAGSFVQTCLSAFRVFPSAARRAHLLSEPARHDRTAGADYLLLGGALSFARLWLDDTDMQTFIGARDISALISEGRLGELGRLDSLSTWWLSASGLLAVAIIWGACFVFVRDAAALTVHGRGIVGSSLRATAFLILGIITGSLLWVGNVAEPGFFFLDDGFRVTDALLLSQSQLTALLSLTILMSLTFGFLAVALRWRLRRFGAARYTLTLLVETVVLYTACWGSIVLLAMGLASHFLLSEPDRLVNDWIFIAIGLAEACIGCAGLALSLRFRRHRTAFTAAMPQLTPLRPIGQAEPIRPGWPRLRPAIILGAWLLLAGLGCATASWVLDRRALVIEAVAAPGRRAPTEAEMHALGTALVQRLQKDRAAPELPVLVAADGGVWIWLQTFAARMDSRQPARRFIIALQGPPLDGAAKHGSVSGAVRGPVVVSLALPDTPVDMMDRFASATLEATFPIREARVRLQEDPSGSTARETLAQALRSWPSGEATWSSAQLLLGLIHERTDLKKANELYTSVLEKGILKVDASINLGRLALNDNRLDVANEFHRRAIRMAPWSATSHFELAVALRIQALAEPDGTTASRLHQQTCREWRTALKLGFNPADGRFGPGRERNVPALSCPDTPQVDKS